MHKFAKTQTMSSGPSLTPSPDAGTHLPALLTIADVAAVLKVSVRTVRRLIEAGSLDVIRIGRSVRIAPEALKTMVGSG